MSTVIAIGDSHELQGFALVGAIVVRARNDAEIERAWNDCADDAGLVILTAIAAHTLQERLDEQPDVLTAVLP